MLNEIGQALELLMGGRLPEKLDVMCVDNDDECRLAEKVNHLIDYVGEIHGFIFPLSKGELRGLSTMSRGNQLASPFKELHSRLLHLVWQAEQVAQGDYRQRIDFMGEFSDAFNFMVVSLEEKEKALKDKILELEDALLHIKRLEGILPICSNCKKIRVEGYDPRDMEGWLPLESYFEARTETRFTHSICPDCIRKLYPEYADQKK
jgi:hypothetical protein